MYVRNCWYVAAWSHELEASKPIARRIIDEPLVLYRTPDGAVVALQDRCCHRHAPLSLGQVEGDALRCMYHGLLFSPAGRCIEIPGQDVIPPQARVRSFATLERHSWIWVWMGEADEANRALVPPAIGLDDPAWSLQCGQIDYDANYVLVNDNLTDFSHLSYVHKNSFGADEQWARKLPRITRFDRGIHVERWIKNLVPMIKDRPELRDPAARVDNFSSYDYWAPGVLLLSSATYWGGTAERLAEAAPTGAPVSRTFSSQAITPVSATRSRYFFSWGVPSGPGTDAVAAGMLEIAKRAFEEDRRIIEAQQRVINEFGDESMVAIAADAGPLRMRRVMKALCDAEQVAV